MRIDGKWHPCDDGVVRPVLFAEALRADGVWVEFYFLLDTGADRTVFSADVLRGLGMQLVDGTQNLQGVGGKVESVSVATQIRLMRENGTNVLFNGQFAAFTDPTALDMSVLGRDRTNLFAVIVDRLQDVVRLLGQRHRYEIVEA